MSTERLTVDVERLTFGFDALAHHDRQVVFVPYAAPGDRVVARVTERRRGWVRADIDTIVAPGPDRVLPGCPYFLTCGGCQWQHVAPPAQRAAKAAIVAEQLARIAGVRDAEVLPTLATEDWRYRARISLVVEGRRAGYHRARSHALVEVRDCPIADETVAAHLADARAWVAAVRAPLRRVTIVAVPGGVALAAVATAAPGAPDRAATEDLLRRRASIRGAVLRGPGARLVLGDASVHLSVEDGLGLELPADVFAQVNPAANRLLVATVVAFASPARGARVLDLYCGAGNLTFPLARRGATVEGVERDAVAVDAARANAARLRAAGTTFRRAAVADALAGRAAGTIDTVVLDPPRAGAADAVAPLAALRPPRIVYVSCDPATLARDVGVLAARGYRVARVQPIDVFPQTYHVESVAELRLG